MILTAYGSLQLERMSAKDRIYNVLNLFGAALILVSLLFKFNLSAFIIELAWLFISVYGLWQSFKHQK